MKRKLLDFLACPTCQEDLTLKDVTQTLDEEIITGQLYCAPCQKIYPIIKGVPRFVTDNLESAVTNTVNGFGFQWGVFNNTARSGKMGSHELFFDFIKPVLPGYFQGKLIVDAGCGVGRFCRVAVECGAGQVIGVDLSSSVEVAYQNLLEYPNAHIVQADITRLPLKPLFDHVYSVGVLHHTIDPKKSFQSIVKLLKSEGSVSVWVYGRENNEWIIRLVNPLRVYLTSHLPRKLLYALCLPLTASLYLALKLIYYPVNAYPSLSWLRRFLFYNDYLFFLSKFGFQEQFNIVYDHLVPEVTYYISRDELETWFTENQLQSVTITSRTGNSWRGFGVKGI